MGKLSPSMRSPQLPLNLLKPQPSPKSKPISKSPKPKPKIKKPPPTTNPQNEESPNLNNIFTSPSLSSALSTLRSLPKHPDSLNPSLLLQSFLSLNPSPSDALSFFSHLHTTTPPSRHSLHSLLTHSLLSTPSDSLPDPSPVLSLMSLHHHPPDPSSADIAVRSLCSVHRPDHALHLLLHHFPAAPDHFTYNFLLRHLAKTHPISSLHYAIDSLRQRHAIDPDNVTYTILINAACKSRNLREATRLLSVLKQQPSGGFRPDCYLYNAIMKGYCTLDQCGEVMEVYNKMKDEGVEPDLVTYNTLVYGLSKAGMLEQARRFLNVMAGMGHFPDTVTYTSLMNGMCRKGDAMGAVALLGEMEEKGCKPNECTYNTLLMGLCKAKCLEKGKELYGVMREGGMRLEAAAYGSFVRALCRAGRVAEAYEVFDYVLESRSLSEVSAYSALESSLKWMKNARGTVI